MSTSIKPTDAMISIKGIKAGFDITRKALESKDVKTSKGVSMHKLEAKLNSSTNAAAKEMPMFIYRNFKKKVTGYTTNCSTGKREKYERYETKETLNKTDVKNILALLTEAKKQVPKLDINDNKIVDQGEAEAAQDLGGLMGKMVSAAVHGARDAYGYALDKWQDAIFGVMKDIKTRTKVDSEINRMAKHHCRYKAGREAMVWAFRDLATSGRENVVRKSMDSVLMRAEDKTLSPFERMVMGSDRTSDANKKGHLNNTEVKHLLGVDDLEAFVAATKARVEARVGDYEGAFLKGADIPGSADITDEDFRGNPNKPTPHTDHC